MKKLSSLMIFALILAGLCRMCVYTVNEREYALVFALGELRSVVDEPGLHVKLPPPLRNVVYLDKRILNLDTDGADLVQTSEKKNLLIDTFVKWRIEDPRLYWVSFQVYLDKRILNLDTDGADLVQTSEKKNLLIDTFVKWRIEDPRLYWVSFQGSEPAAMNRVSALLRDVLNVVVNKRTVNQITSSEREKAMGEIATLLQDRVKDVGIRIVDVRLKRVDFTPEISESVYRRMEAERKRVASEERSKGLAQAERIRALADRESEVILAQAYRDAQKIKGDGDAEAADIYAKAFNRDPEFARFYRSLEAYRSSFANKDDVMVLDPSAEFFRYFKKSESNQ